MSDSAPRLELLAGDENERLAAARSLRINPRDEAVGPLKAALAREHVRWVKTALVEAIDACEAVRQPIGTLQQSRENDEAGDTSQAYADGRRDGLQQALHELTPLLGLARAAAENELSPGSAVQTQLERMRTVSAALRQMVNASGVPERNEFDLAKLLRDFERAPPVPCEDDVVGTRGDSPFFIKGDPGLLGLAVQPVIANAIEAVLSVDPSPPKQSVMISWGTESGMYWIAVIDSGPGPPPQADVFALGATDKEGHFGLGLATVATAMESLDGSPTMEQNARGGTTVILRWPKVT